MLDFLNDYFGPLGKEYCAYFYFLSVFFFFMYVITLIGVFIFIFKNYKNRGKVNLPFFINSIMMLINLLLGYFINRLLNTMCVNSIH